MSSEGHLGRLRSGGSEGGFTLIELLVVITILGILAAVVVFAVGGLGDKGQGAACKTDYTEIQTAEEAYFAKAGSYGTMDQLTNGNGTTVTGPLLESASKWYSVSVPTGGASYSVGLIGNTCTLPSSS